ncbi:outer membrane protein OmpA-like peptidoglycan-associated protein [Aquimarina sp. MAR_2010_214]|uniref:OmpA family protein n=1 Tax=Aquimarina sp. MAR_2010_214 TaxID=1250026 RepID=UPI000C715667|nr:hypothetical protein [Aquimarina sp. MAR_2010_214]PKV49126.1 outer membrane protein OmpA-like peptidoglycan-associated protein [Aquimarina sp. MAR_2010_214]
MFKSASTNTASAKSSNPSLLENEKKGNGFIQPKLNIGKSNDTYEIEADRVADTIVTKRNDRNKSLFGSPLTPGVQKSEEKENEIQEKSISESITPLIQKQEPSEPLPPDSRTFLFPSISQTFGRFGVTYFPNDPLPLNGILNVELKVHFTFNGRFTPEEQLTFTQNFENSIENAWSNKHRLVLNDPNMDQHFSNVQINIVTVDSPADAQFTTTVARRNRYFRSNVEGTQVELDNNDADNSKSNQVTRADFFKQVGDFGFDSSTINSDVQQDLDEVTSFLNSIPQNIRAAEDIDNMLFMEYTGRASSGGNRAYNKRLSQKRIDSVKGHIDSQFPELTAIESVSADGEVNTQAESKYRRVDVKIDSPLTNELETTNQNTAAHEAGHMFGLDDEYIEENRSKHRFEGDEPDHANLVEQLIGNEAAEELRVGNNESIMSHGMEVKRGHYLPFLAAIIRLTGNDNWNVE